MTLPTTRSSSRLAGLALAGLMTFASVPVLADVKAGVDAWSAGNFEAAVNEWKGPAEAGDADAMFNLAQAYRLGRGVPADLERAKELYAQAALKGHVKAADNYGLLLFQQGNQTEAMPLIKAAADRGDPRAQYVLGLAHFNADYAEKDWVRAYALLTLAQSAGLSQATTALGQMDQYVPMEQRQAAQAVARDLDIQAERLRAAQAASVELSQPASATVAAAPTPAPTPTPAPAPVREAPPPRVAQVSQPAVAPAISQPAPAAPLPRAQVTTTQSDGPWRVQLGAFGVAGNADRLWNRLSSSAALAGKRKFLVPAGNITRLQAGGFASRAEAQRACNALKSSGQACLVTRS